MAPPIPVTEDTPPDMLAGSMDLSVMLPSGHSLKMSVERSTPMMDLLVQVTTANKMSPAGYIIQPLNEQGPLPYKPSTPIGALDAWTIHVVPKQNVHCTAVKKPLKILNQPFEQTFRLQVHLPRNQLYVARVSPRTRLADILLQVCSEKNLDPIKYSLRHPSNLDQVLRLSCTLGDYKLQEITLVCNRSHPVEVSSVDIMSLQRDTTNPAYRSTMCEGSVSSGSLEGRSLSPVPSDGSSASPPPLPPSRPIRKRRPAPKPPTLTQKVSEEKLQNGVQSSTVMYHSRNSSDSSGYHEASVLSESPQNHSITETLSRRKMESVSEADSATSLSKSMTDVTVIEPSLQQATSYNSITSLSSVPGRKKKTAAPPPPVPNNRTTSVTEDQQRTPSVSSTASSTTTLDGNEVKVAVKSATLPPSSRLNSVPKESSPPPSPVPAATVEVEPLPPTTPQDGMSGESPYPQDNTSELQSVQVLRNILSHSPANLTSSLESETDLQHSDPPNSVQRLEDTVDSSDGVIKFGRSQSEDNPVTWNPISKIQHSSSLDQDYPKSTSNIQRGVPNINLSTWNERPKRQISIKNDNDYTSGFGKKIVSQDETVVEERANAKVLQRLASSSRDPGQEEVKTLSQRFKLEGRSKSVTDLSRVPVVRAVELKKPFATHIFDQPLLKPISHVAESKSSSNNTKSENPNLLEQESNSDNTFIGVNSLARKFGVPNKRPVSMYGTSTSKNMQHESKEITKPLTSTFGNKEIFPGVVLQKTNERLEGLGEANTSEHHSKPNLTTSEIKAQAKISSGGFLIGDSSLSSPSTETPHVDKNADGLLGSNSQKYKEGTSREDAHPFNSSIENKNKDVPKTKVTATANDSSPSSPTQKVVSTGLYRQSQTLDRKTRPISLQPVVKGFRVSTEAPNSPKDKLSPLSPKTKDFITLPITVNSVKIPVSSTHKVSYQRALSTPVISTYSSMKINESAKEKIQDKVSSVPSTPTGTTKDITSVPPPPPPLMPILKPVSSRNIKLLPPPAAKPRDQLMLSIRSFSVDKLKPVSTQTKSSDNKKDLI
uniref:WH2 domain-containing protein n=1 Tax=Graphocephala atropunctata TaxID=36148 RepID=A0A1B6LWB0_9HEMI